MTIGSDTYGLGGGGGSGGASYTFTNGLTETDGTVKLGGNITGDVTLTSKAGDGILIKQLDVTGTAILSQASL